MAETTGGLAQQVVKRARQKALVKDAVKVLRGLRKRSCGESCAADSKKKKGKKGLKPPFPKKAALAEAIKRLKAVKAKTASPTQGIVKAAVLAIVAIKSGNELQKQAAIGDLLKKILPFLGKQLGRVGRQAKGFRTAMTSGAPALPGGTLATRLGHGAGKALEGAKSGLGAVKEKLTGMSAPMQYGAGGLAGLGGVLGGKALLSDKKDAA